jgi:hypothetical protein
MLTQAKLKEILHYNPETGIFTWIKKNSTGNDLRGNKNQIGKQCTCLDVNGYVQINAFGKVNKAHRLAWLYMTGQMPEYQIDHINHIRNNNKWVNLRVVNNHENHLNRPMQRNNKTGFVGVFFNKKTKKYIASITFKGKKINLGCYSEFENAVAARKKANIDYGFSELHGIGYGKSKYKKYN